MRFTRDLCVDIGERICSRANRERNCIRVLAGTSHDERVRYGSRNRCRIPARGIEHEHKRRAWRRNIGSRNRRRQLMTAEETGHPGGTIPIHQGVSTKIVAVNCQQELIAACGYGVWRD